MVFNSITCFNKSLRQKFAQKTYQNSTTCESENERDSKIALNSLTVNYVMHPFVHECTNLFMAAVDS